MSAEVEFRRFRTWEAETEGRAVRSWWLLIRYMVNRYARQWYVYMVIILGIFGAMLGLFLSAVLGSDSGHLAVGARPDIIQEGPMAFIGIGMILFTLLVTAPSIAEDLRFNAQLFYFSKPLRVRDYMLGKNLFNFMGLAVVGLVPVLLLAASTLAAGPGDETLLRQQLAEQGASQGDISGFIQEWRFSGVDTWGDALYLAFMPVLAVITLSIGLVGITLAVSSFTRRAWHAAVGTAVLVTAWSILGAVVGDPIENTRGALFYPFGWVYAITFLPLQARFPMGFCNPDYEYYEAEYCTRMIGGADGTILGAHMLLIVTGFLGILVAWLRMKRLEGAA